MMGKNFSRWHFGIFLLFFLENRIWHFMQIVSGDNLHEMSDPILNLSSAESAHSEVSVKLVSTNEQQINKLLSTTNFPFFPLFCTAPFSYHWKFIQVTCQYQWKKRIFGHMQKKNNTKKTQASLCIHAVCSPNIAVYSIHLKRSALFSDFNTTLVMLSCLAFQLSANQLLDTGCWYNSHTKWQTVQTHC